MILEIVLIPGSPQSLKWLGFNDGRGVFVAAQW
jgi:hypothetical protein